jgi:hypothetical protein
MMDTSSNVRNTSSSLRRVGILTSASLYLAPYFPALAIVKLLQQILLQRKKLLLN